MVHVSLTGTLAAATPHDGAATASEKKVASHSRSVPETTAIRVNDPRRV